MTTFISKTLTAVLIFTVISQIQLSGKELFLVFENGCYGYIDSTGQMVISPIYLNAGEFRDGLAPARISGKFGYINSTGKWAIPPQYSYATSFSEGFAIVYNDSTPYYIDTSGNIAFEPRFFDISAFRHKRAVVSSAQQKKGVINIDGDLIIDTLYDYINELKRGYFRLQNKAPDSVRAMYIVGLVDSTGHFLVPMGKYREIEACGDDYLKLQSIHGTGDDETYIDHVMDYEGKTLFKKKWPINYWINGPFNCGLASIHLYRNDKAGNRRYNSDYSYYGYVNLRGEIVINDTSFQSVTDFSSNRAFVQSEDRNYSMINTKGEIVCPKIFDYVHTFENGVAEVRDEERKWGIIDTNGNWIIAPKFAEISRLSDNLFFYESFLHPDLQECKYCVGFGNYQGEILTDPIFKNIDCSGFKDGLLKCDIDNKLTYINPEFKVVWQQHSSSETQLKPLNIDFMNRGYFYAFSKPLNNYYTGHGTSSNGFKPLDPSAFSNVPEIFLNVNTVVTDTIYSNYEAYRVTLGNKSVDTIWFNTQDSRLYMKVQAKTKDGQWHDIEYLPSSWCGNSYHRVYLAPKSYWQFATPSYTGDIPVHLRVELVYIDPSGASHKNEYGYEIPNEVTIYSNEYNGSINSAQMWRKPGYSPSGLMDPYLE